MTGSIQSALNGPPDDSGESRGIREAVEARHGATGRRGSAWPRSTARAGVRQNALADGVRFGDRIEDTFPRRFHEVVSEL
jgi:hypothetical protein